ncbi:MAG: hypothetical protein IH598_02670 [Bacteroidales bacterium]|nr:hypothetical protein [Bacteroidales bacterium]
MKNTIALTRNPLNVKTVLIDLSALAFIYFVPALSHLLALPVYFIEPMRLMLIIAIAHTSQKNAFIIAATLPLFSFLISAHPHLIKMLLITAELMLNAWLFYFILKKSGNALVSMISAIVISKAAYYLLKFGLISTLLISGSLVSTPLIIQLITTLAFSGYLFFIFRNKA